MSESILGILPSGTADRDAVHIAIIPMVAADILAPGCHVSVVDGAAELGGVPIGIVDPFLLNAVTVGQRFWLCLYPKSITSLRHAWQHPALPVNSPTYAQAYLNDFATKARVSYGTMMLGIEKFLAGGRGSMEDATVETWDSEEITDEFWNHYQAVTGIVVPKEKRGDFFGCCI